MYSKNAIRLYSLLISIVITLGIQQLGIRWHYFSQGTKDKVTIAEATSETEVIPEQESALKNKEETEQEHEEIWQVMIPKIDLIAPIQEGVEQSTIKKTVGHFPETGIWEGNIGLASHNRGIRANFFENIKQLTKGDIIIYQKGENQKQYLVETVTIISEQDWSYLQPTSDNRMTLITCVINQPNYRLCVQAKESIQ